MQQRMRKEHVPSFSERQSQKRPGQPFTDCTIFGRMGAILSPWQRWRRGASPPGATLSMGKTKLIPKTIGNRKRDCAWGCAWGINTTWEICRSKSTNQFGERNERLPDLCFSICRFSQVVFIPQAQPHAQSLFLFPIVFGINLIHFFDEKEQRCSRKFDRVLCCFDPLSITPFDSAKNTNCFEKCNVFGNGKFELSAFQKVRNWGAKFLARKSAKLFSK